MKRWQFWLGIAMGAACIAYVISTIKNPGDFVKAFSSANYWYLVPITGAYLIIMILRAVRWQYILNHCGRASLKNSVVSILVCYMGNNIFPLRAGEFMRVFLIGKQEESISYSAALATVVVERLFDFLTILLSLAVVLMIIDFPEGGLPITIGEDQYDLANMIRGMGTATLIAAALLFAFLILLNARTRFVLSLADRFLGFFTDRYAGADQKSLMKKLLKDRPRLLREWIMSVLERFSSGLQIMGQPRALLMLAVMSIIIWFVNLSPVWFSGMAFHQIGHISFTGCLFLLVVGAAAASIPGPPGFFGIFHAFIQFGLLFFMNDLNGQQINSETALSFAIILHGCYYFPVIAAGAVAAWMEGYSLTKLKEEAEGTGAEVN